MKLAELVGRIAWSAALLLGAGAACHADTVFLKNGNEVEGTVSEDNDRTVVIKLRSGGSRSFRRADVETVVYDRLAPVNAGPVPSAAPAPASAPEPAAKPAAKPEPAAEGTGTGAKTPGDKTDKDDKAAKDDAGGKDEKSGTGEEKWTAPQGLAGFPVNAKRMPAAKEAAFLAALPKLASSDAGVRQAGKSEIEALGADALPYVVAGINHANVDARTICMNLIGEMNGKAAVKFVIEIFFAAMPDAGAAVTYQVPFIRAIKQTLPGITGQTFITVQPDKSMVQDGLKQYIAWYNASYDQLPPQLGEPAFDSTDPDYGKKLKEARQLKLAKRSWPRPALPADQSSNKRDNNRAEPSADLERASDRRYRDSIPTMSRDEGLNRR